MDETANPEDIVQYIVDELSERGLSPLKTALVKFVYLADVESIRSGLPRVTGLRWILYKYGPYSFELDRAIEHVVGRTVDEMTSISSTGKSYRTYRSRGHGEDFRLSPQQRGIINTVLDRWAGEDLKQLLNYVYFETEPMLDAHWEQLLEFSLVHPRQHVPSLADFLSAHTSPDRIRELAQLKARFWEGSRARRVKRIKPSPQPRYDEVLATGLRMADEDNTSQ